MSDVFGTDQPTTTDKSPDTTESLLVELRDLQKQQRDEIAAQRDEIAQLRAHVTTPRPVTASRTRQSPEELVAARMAEVNEHDFYCPGCGKLVDYHQQCRGTAEAPHPPIEVVSTDELRSGDPTKHTAAPVT